MWSCAEVWLEIIQIIFMHSLDQQFVIRDDRVQHSTQYKSLLQFK